MQGRIFIGHSSLQGISPSRMMLSFYMSLDSSYMSQTFAIMAVQTARSLVVLRSSVAGFRTMETDYQLFVIRSRPLDVFPTI